MDEIKKLRTEIDEIDEIIILSLSKRFQLTNKVGEIKLESDIAVLDEEREKRKRAMLEELATQLKIKPKVVLRIYDIIINASKDSQTKLKTGV